MKNILLTGGLGYIGSKFYELYSNEYNITILDKNFFGNYLKNINNLIVKDIRDLTLNDVSDFDAVVHMAELSNDPLGELEPNLTNEINHISTANLLDLCNKTNVKKFIYMSSCSVYGFNEETVDENSETSPLTNYSKAKVLNEDYILNNEFDYEISILRNATVFGYSANLRLDLVINDLTYGAFRDNKIVLLSDGTPVRPFVHVEDLSRFINFLLVNKNSYQKEVINVGSDSMNFSIKQLAEFLSDYLNIEEVIFGKADPDQRSYKVSFEKIENLFPSFHISHNLKSGIIDLLENYKKYEDRIDSKRIMKIKSMIQEGKINNSLR